MLLYNLTVQKATGITHAICGNFCGLDEQEIVVSRGKALELLRCDINSEKINVLCSTDLFAIVRSIGKFRPLNKNKDCLIVGCDSGKLIILEYNMKTNIFDKVYESKFGKSGCRRNVPGQFLAIDPYSHAAMIAAVESQKLVYVFNHEAPSRVPAPLPDSDTVLYDLVALDAGCENTVFACLETKYKNGPGSGEVPYHACQQTLTYYMLSSEKKEVRKKCSEPLSQVGNMLISVPHGIQGPGGVLICSENYITYKNLGDQPEIRCPIPKRKNDLDDPERSMIFCCSATHAKPHMPGYLILAQTEQGDIYKITLEMDKNQKLVTEMKLKYFDTIPVATAMCIVNSCCLFAASEFGNHYLYKLFSSADDDNEPEFSSAVTMEEGMTFSFSPRSLKNLFPIEELESFSPIIHSQVGDLCNMNIPQIYLACGRGPRSTLHVLKHAVEINQLSCMELSEVPSGCWDLKYFLGKDPCILVSFENSATILLVLSIEERATMVERLGFLPVNSLSCSRFGEHVFVQIYPDGIRIIDELNLKACDWHDDRKITKCAVNEQQVVVVLSELELVYFEFGMPAQMNELGRKKMSSKVTCVALSAVCPLNQKSMILAAGLAGNVLQIISLGSSNVLELLNEEQLPDVAESICIAYMNFDMNNESQIQSHFVLHIGLQNGVLLRKYLNQDTGLMSNTSARHLGCKPVCLFKVQIQNNDAVIATCESTWLSYCYQNDIHLVPLWHETLSYASSFPSYPCPDSILGICENKINILNFENLNLKMTHSTTLLNYTPRKFVIDPRNRCLFVIESDHGAYTKISKELKKKQIAKEMIESADKATKEQMTEAAQAFLDTDLPEHVFGAPKAGLGTWASVISVVDPMQEDIVFRVDLEQNEAAVSICLLNFDACGDIQYLLVGIVKELQLCPQKCSGGVIHTYKVSGNGTILELCHKTEVYEAPVAMCAFQGMVLVGIGRVLHLFAFGEAKLIHSGGYKYLPNHIVTINAIDNHIVVSDVQEGFFFFLYKPEENKFILFCRNTDTKHITASALIDGTTVASADKFGNIHLLRLPPSVSNEVDDRSEHSMIASIQEGRFAASSFQKAEVICSFHVGEMVHSLQKVALLPGSRDSLLYTTLSGTIGVLAPFICEEEQKFFQLLELYIRSEYTFPCGRDHLSFRSSYFPARNVIDGDLCEKFHSLDLMWQQSISKSFGMSPREVSAKLKDIRAKYAF